MARKRTPQERLQELKQKKKKLEAQAQRERQKVRQEERKKDTRRKIALGGALIAQARTDSDAARLVQQLIAEMPERDRQAFEGWEPPKPAHESAAADPPAAVDQSTESR